MIARVAPAPGPLTGRVRVPGDKSISHRAVLFAGMARGTSRLSGVLDSEDVRATLRCAEALGATVRVLGRDGRGLELEVTGWGADGAASPGGPLDCGNSGTTARLLMGVLAGSATEAILTGDSSLSRRPMGRVAEPLQMMGADVHLTSEGTLPAAVSGRRLRAITYDMPVASAQVKSAVLLAGLGAQGRTTVRSPAPSRDHTERMLPAFGVRVGRDAEDEQCWVDGPAALTAAEVSVPADPSSAAFLAAAAVLVRGSDVTLPDVGMNPTRIGFLGVLGAMAADVSVEMEKPVDVEPVGALRARGTGRLEAIDVGPESVPSMIDEIPVLAVVATQARGTTRFEGVGELRVKESDRLEALRAGLSMLGADVRAGADWLEVTGPVRLAGAELDSLGDHRLAMAWAVAGLVAEGPVTIRRWDAVCVSYPGFADDLEALGAPGVVLS